METAKEADALLGVLVLGLVDFTLSPSFSVYAVQYFTITGVTGLLPPDVILSFAPILSILLILSNPKALKKTIRQDLQDLQV